jgi:hypothetical protein
MKRPLLYLGLAGCLAMLSGCESCGHKTGGPQGTAMKPPTRAPQRPQGTPALHVTPGAAEPFVKSDVVAYFQTHNLPRNGGTTSQIHVDSLELITSGEVTNRLHGVQTGLPDGDRVGFATLSGTFLFSAPSSKPKAFQRAYAAFDAGTGNLLMIGTLDQADKLE